MGRERHDPLRFRHGQAWLGRERSGAVWSSRVRGVWYGFIFSIFDKTMVRCPCGQARSSAVMVSCGQLKIRYGVAYSSEEDGGFGIIAWFVWC